LAGSFSFGFQTRQNLYPTPDSVLICVGLFGSDSIFCRR